MIFYGVFFFIIFYIWLILFINCLLIDFIWVYCVLLSVIEVFYFDFYGFCLNLIFNMIINFLFFFVWFLFDLYKFYDFWSWFFLYCRMWLRGLCSIIVYKVENFIVIDIFLKWFCVWYDIVLMFNDEVLVYN